MNDSELDALVARAAVVLDAEVGRWPLDAQLHDHCEAIMTTPTLTEAPASEEPRAPAPATTTPRRRPARTIALAALAAAATFVAAFTFVGRDAPATKTARKAWGAEALKFANNSPLLLLGHDWSVERAHDDPEFGGELGFTRGGKEAELRWSDEPLDDKAGDRSDGGINRELATEQVVGQEARLFAYSDDDHTALWRFGDRTVELRADLDESSFRAVLRSIREVDVDTWLSAMPASVVKPADRAGVVEEMLRGVEVPPGFDHDRIRPGGSANDRYNVGADVTGAVACGWVERWLTALETGDAATAAAAVEAMRGSRQWPILVELDAQGGWSDAVWEIADRMERGDRTLGDTGVMRSGGADSEDDPFADQPAYKLALGCT